MVSGVHGTRTLQCRTAGRWLTDRPTVEVSVVAGTLINPDSHVTHEIRLQPLVPQAAIK